MNIYNIMPWYNGKFFFDKDKINMSEQRFNSLPIQSLTSDDLLVFNNSTNEVNSRPVASIGAVGPTGATGVRGLDGNSSLWEFKSFTSGQPGAGEFRLDAGNTYGDGEIIINRTDNFGTDMTNWLQNIEIGDTVTFRNYNSYEYFAIYVVSVSPTTQTNTVTLDPAIPPDLLDAYGLPGTAGQNGAFEVDALYTIGYVKRGLQGPSGGSGPINSTVSFFSDFCKIPGGGMYNMSTFALDPVNNLQGVPILPHGSGAFASTFGSAMQLQTGFLNNANIWTYGAYMPQAGVIYCAAINYFYTNPITALSGRILAINYTTGDVDTIYTLIGPGDRGSADQTFSTPISFNRGHYIGIAIQNLGLAADEIVVEGTLFLKLT